MSSVDLSSPSGDAGIREHSKSSNLLGPKEKSKNLESISMKMMEIAEKLESVNQQCHVLQVENKVLRHAHDGGPDLNTFLSPQARLSRPIPPAKRQSNFLIPAFGAGTSKGSTGRKNFSSLSTSQQFEALHQIAKEQSDIVLNFEGLKKAITASQMSSSLKKTIGFAKDTNDLSSLAAEHSSGSKETEPEELTFIKHLLEDQEDLNEKLIHVESQRIRGTLDLLSAKMEVAKEFAVTKDIYKDMICNKNDDDSDHDAENEENDENADQNNREVTDEESVIQRKIERKRAQLAREEARLNQMRFVVQKLMASCPNNAMMFDDVTNQQHYDMLKKCGQDIEKLRGDV